MHEWQKVISDSWELHRGGGAGVWQVRFSWGQLECVAAPTQAMMSFVVGCVVLLGLNGRMWLLVNKADIWALKHCGALSPLECGGCGAYIEKFLKHCGTPANY